MPRSVTKNTQSIESELRKYKDLRLTYSEALWMLRKNGVSPKDVKRLTSFSWKNSQVAQSIGSPIDNSAGTKRHLPKEFRQVINVCKRQTAHIVLCIFAFAIGAGVSRLELLYPIGLAIALMAVIAGIVIALYTSFKYKAAVFYGGFMPAHVFVNTPAILIGLFYAGCFTALGLGILPLFFK